MNIISKDNYAEYAPYDIVAVDEWFHKLFDRNGTIYQLDYGNPPSPSDILGCVEGTTWANAFDDGNWVKIEKVISLRCQEVTFRHFIHKSISKEYLERTNGRLEWDHLFVYEILVGHRRVILSRNNYSEFSPRKMMAFADLYCSLPDNDIIDESGNWFHLDDISDEQLLSVFPNYKDFTCERDETFFHMGLGRGMWVDKSIAEEFGIEAQKIYNDNCKQERRSPHLLYPVWKETVWKILSRK